MAITQEHEWVHGDAQGTHVEEVSTICVSSERISAVRKTTLSQTRDTSTGIGEASRGREVQH